MDEIGQKTKGRQWSGKRAVKGISLLIAVMIAVSAFGCIGTNVYAQEQASVAQIPEGYTGIYSADDLKNIALGGNYILMNDIEVDGDTFVNGTFTGVFDGNNHKITRTQCNNNLISNIGIGAVVKNLTVEMIVSETTVEYDDSGFGTINGYNCGLASNNYGTITGCKVLVTNKNNCKNVMAYGIVYANSGEISHCEVTMNAGTNVSGFSVTAIAQENEQNGVISDCVSRGKTCNPMVETNIGKIENCTNYADIIAGEKVYGIGAIAGSSTGFIINSKNEGDIEVRAVVGCLSRYGGIVGDNNGAIVGCENNGSIKILASEQFAYVGGIAGIMRQGVIVDCDNKGQIMTEQNAGVRASIGGIVSRTESSTADDYVYIENCHNSGTLPVNDDTDIYSGNIIDSARSNVILKNSGSEQDIRWQYDDSVNIISSDNEHDLAVSADSVELKVGAEYGWLTQNYDNVRYMITKESVATTDNGTIQALSAGFCAIIAVDDSTGKSGYIIVSVKDVPFSWEIKDGVLTINGTGEMPMASSDNKLWSERIDEIKKVVINEGMTKISDSAFSGCKNLTAVELPESLKTIDRWAFSGCLSLESIDLKKVSILMQGAFRRSGLKKIVIPGTVSFIDYGVFEFSESLADVYFDKKADSVRAISVYSSFNGCDSLEAIRVSDERTDIVSIDGVLYSVYANDVNAGGYVIPANSLQLLCYPYGKKDEEFKLPDNVSSTNFSAFSGKFKRLILNEGLLRVGSEHLYDLDELVIPSTLKYSDMTLHRTKRVVNNSSLDIPYCVSQDEIYYSEADNKQVDKFYAGGSYYRVQKPTMIEIKDNGEGFECYAGETLQLGIIYHPDDAVQEKVNWKSSDESIATVNSDGLVTGVSMGLVTITAEVADNPDMKWDKMVTIMPKPHVHSFSDEWSSDENYHWHECVASGCSSGPFNSTPEKIDENRHVSGDWVVTKEPTATEKGSRIKTCTVCGRVVASEEMDVLQAVNDDNGIALSVDGWHVINGVRYWYENGTRQGARYNSDGSIDTSYRGKEIYDPSSNAWYWLDNIQSGAVAKNKDVYQDSLAGEWGDSYNDNGEKIGKWVRYDENGHMVKGWQYTSEGTYYFDVVYGTMAKGNAAIDGKNYYFDTYTGIMKEMLDDDYRSFKEDGWHKVDGVNYWYEGGMRQGAQLNDDGSIDETYRGKEIYDPSSDAWYWLDNVQSGAVAKDKDVYQDSLAGEWGDSYNDNGEKIGKWVRYDENGHMVKGWNEKDGNVYYFDPVYGTMAKGEAVIDGQTYYFDDITGVLR